VLNGHEHKVKGRKLFNAWSTNIASVSKCFKALKIWGTLPY